MNMIRGICGVAVWLALLALAGLTCGCRTYVIAPGVTLEPGCTLIVNTYSEKAVETPVNITGGKLK